MKLLQIIGLLTGICLSACSSVTTTSSEKYQNQSAEQIFKAGEKALNDHAYRNAVEHFEALDTLYPFGPYAERAQLDLMYSYYRNDDPASTAATAERFIHLYPRSEYVDYAYYMKGLADFDQDRGWLQRYVHTDLSQRDPGTERRAFDDFNTLVKLFPHSRYANDAKHHMIYLRNLFAGHELSVARYYYRRGAYVAAANRANVIVQHFQGTDVMPDALAMMVKAYRKLQLEELADRALVILRQNYPRSKANDEIR
jgi:outer membrane protein assembly factor BamD